MIRASEVGVCAFFLRRGGGSDALRFAARAGWMRVGATDLALYFGLAAVVWGVVVCNRSGVSFEMVLFLGAAPSGWV